MRRGVETIAAGRTERPYGTFTSYVAFDRTDEAQLQRALETTEPDVVLDLACWEPSEVEAVARACRNLELAPRGVTASPTPGRAGNVEFLLHAVAGGAEG